MRWDDTTRASQVHVGGTGASYPFPRPSAATVESIQPCRRYRPIRLATAPVSLHRAVQGVFQA